MDVYDDAWFDPTEYWDVVTWALGDRGAILLSYLKISDQIAVQEKNVNIHKKPDVATLAVLEFFFGS